MKEPALTNDYVSTAQVSAALGVSVSTVKRWVEDGILPAQKTAGGHRKLRLADVLELARRNNLPLRDSALAASSGRKRRPVDVAVSAVEFYDALIAGDADAIRRTILGAYRSGVPIEELADAVVAPGMHRVGEEWAKGRLDVMHEHRASQQCAAALYELKSVLETRALRDRPLAIGGAVEGDFSELPTLLAQLVLLDAGWQAINLGPSTPLASLRLAVKELQPRLVWLSMSHLLAPEAFVREYARFYREAERAGVPVAIGGRAMDGPLRSAIPYTTYGDRLSHLAAFARTLHPRPRRPRRGRPAR